jgi:hypothetical protein
MYVLRLCKDVFVEKGLISFLPMCLHPIMVFVCVYIWCHHEQVKGGFFFITLAFQTSICKFLMTSLCVQTRVNNGRFSPIYFSSTTSHIDFVQVSEIFQVFLSLSSWSFPLLRSLNDVSGVHGSALAIRIFECTTCGVYERWMECCCAFLRSIGMVIWVAVNIRVMIMVAEPHWWDLYPRFSKLFCEICRLILCGSLESWLD